MWTSEISAYEEKSQILLRFSICLPRSLALPWLSTPRTTWFVSPRTSEKTLWQRSPGPCYSGTLTFSFSWTCCLCWRETFCTQDPKRLPHCFQWRNLGHRQLLVKVSRCYDGQSSLQISNTRGLFEKKVVISHLFSQGHDGLSGRSYANVSRASKETIRANHKEER